MPRQLREAVGNYVNIYYGGEDEEFRSLRLGTTCNVRRITTGCVGVLDSLETGSTKATAIYLKESAVTAGCQPSRLFHSRRWRAGAAYKQIASDGCRSLLPAAKKMSLPPIKLHASGVCCEVHASCCSGPSPDDGDTIFSLIADAGTTKQRQQNPWQRPLARPCPAARPLEVGRRASEIEPWQRFPHLRYGYRRGGTHLSCLLSLLQLHNESVNAW